MLALYLGGFNSSLIIYYIFIVSSLFTHLFLFWSPPPPDGNICLPTWFYRILSQKTKTKISWKQSLPVTLEDFARHLCSFYHAMCPCSCWPKSDPSQLFHSGWCILTFCHQPDRSAFYLLNASADGVWCRGLNLLFRLTILVLLWIRWKEEEVSQLFKASCLLCLFVCCLFLCSYKQCPGCCIHMNSGTLSQGKA